MARVSIKDIAAQTGVSFQTVSKVLKGKGTVSAETRAAILETAERLGYIPNVLARGLTGQQTATIGILVSEFVDYVVQFLIGVEREARRHGQGIMVGAISPDGSDCELALRLMIERRIDGIVLAAPHLERNSQVGEVLKDQIPVVSIHNVPGFARYSTVSQEEQAGLLATEHLLMLGHRHIGTIIGDPDRLVTQHRLQTYRQALEAAGVYSPDLVEEGHWQAEGGYAATQRLLDRAPDVTAIFAQNDLMAVGALHALHDKGLRVPQDCAVVGCDDIPTAAHLTPALTTVRLPFSEMGEMAVRLLLALIARRQAEPEHVLLPVNLVPRDSSGRIR